VLHRYRGVGDGSDAVEVFALGVDGGLTHDRVGTWSCDGESEARTLQAEADFERVPYAVVESLHEALMREDFFDALAYRLGQWGKPGYGTRTGSSPTPISMRGGRY
jgi:hypothetical protein